MRVSPNPRLAVGMKLQLAVHTETRETPLILSAVVDRDDGERGLVLRFCDLSAEAGRYLDYVIHALPLVIDDDDEEGCLIAELLEANCRLPSSSVTSIRTLVRVVRRLGVRPANVTTWVPASSAPGVHCKAPVPLPRSAKTAPRAASGVPSANAAESASAPAGSRPRTSIRSGRPTAALRSAADRARGARSPR